MTRGIFTNRSGQWVEVTTPFVKGAGTPPTSVLVTLLVVANGTYTAGSMVAPISQTTFNLSLAPSSVYPVALNGSSTGLTGNTINTPVISGVTPTVFNVSDSPYSDFLNTYGVWNAPGGNYPAETITLNYTLYIASSGTYTLTASADNIVNSIAFDSGPNVLSEIGYDTSASTTVYLAAGLHTVSIVATNQDNPSPASVGATLTDKNSNVVWNTRDTQFTTSAVIQYTSDSEEPLFSGGTITVSGSLITHVFDTSDNLTVLSQSPWNNILRGYVNQGGVWKQFYPNNEISCTITLTGAGGGGGGGDTYTGYAGYPGDTVTTTMILNTDNTMLLYLGGGGGAGGSNGARSGGASGGADSGSGFFGGHGGNAGPEGVSGGGGGGGGATVLLINGAISLVAAGGGGGGGGGDHGGGNPQQGYSSSGSNSGGAGAAKQFADGGGGGGGGAGFPGGAGGPYGSGDSGPPGGGEDVGAYSGSNGQSVVGSGSASPSNNYGAASAPGGDGSATITYTSHTGQPLFTGGIVTNASGIITHTFTAVGAPYTISRV